MIRSASPVMQSLLGTLLTWGLTALGAGVVFFIQNSKRSVLDGSLGFAAGVMTAASFWSLLAPAIEMAETSGSYGSEGQWAFLPVSFGFFLGAAFVYAADSVMTKFGFSSVQEVLDEPFLEKKYDDELYTDTTIRNTLFSRDYSQQSAHISLDLSKVKHRKGDKSGSRSIQNQKDATMFTQQQWKRILLMIVAITVHNIPEGLAVGVGFGAVGKSPTATFEKAQNLAIGIGIQNFPEGMAVSIPLRGAGHSLWSAFFWGQLSGMVEPISGILGALAVSVCEPILPYALSFAAGAMIFVVFDDIIPEAQSGNGRLASLWSVAGFIVMMALDVGCG